MPVRWFFIYGYLSLLLALGNITRSYSQKQNKQSQIFNDHNKRDVFHIKKENSESRKIYANLFSASTNAYTAFNQLLTVTGVINLNIVSTGGSCGYGNGSMIVTASGGTGPYTYTYVYAGSYTWTQNTGNFQNLQGGPYVLTVTDATGQSTTMDIVLPNTYPPPHVDIASSTPPSSCTGSDGEIILSASNGTPPYQYSINGVDFQTSPVFPNLSQGAYGTFVRDANGCVEGYPNAFFLIVDNGNCYNKMSVQGISDYSCNNDGSILLGTPFAGTPPYQYSLDGVNYQSTNLISNVSSGSHLIYFKDATGLTNIFSIYMIDACPLKITFLEVDASCQQNDGALTATVINGTPPYTYTIDGINYQASNTFTGLASGNYTVTVKDVNGGFYSATATVFNKCPTLTVTETDEGCGQKNGTITATGNKGTTPYQFSIDGVNFQSGNVFIGLSAGSYTVTIKDANGFIDSAAIKVNDNCFQVSGTVVNTVCGFHNGKITATAQNGTPPYEYSLDGINYQASNLFPGLAAGSYVLTARDANGLLTNTAVLLTDAPGPQITLTTTQASCNNTNGTITINASGGSNPLLYSIDNGANFQASNTFSSLDSALYISVARDANGCTATDTFRLTALPTPKLFLGNDTLLCTGSTLSLTLPQQAGYTYLWDDNSTGNSYLVTKAGAYSVKVTNQYGCYVSTSINVLFKPTALFSLGNDTVLCNGEVLNLQPMPSPQGNYLWNNGSKASNLQIHSPGLYWLQVTDNGCVNKDSIKINFKSNPQVSLGRDTSLCIGQTLLLDASSNNSLYSWQDGSTNPTFRVTEAGTYTVKVTENGCDTSAQVMVNYLDKPDIHLVKDTTICISQELILKADYPNSTYLWQDGSVQPEFTVSKAGTYSVQVTDHCGMIMDSVLVNFENCACAISVPNAFTPNGDGKNDIFLPKSLCPVSHFEMSVYNRWGQLIFRSMNTSTGWDGTFGSQQQPPGAYVWELSYIDSLTKRNIHKTGTVVLIR